MRNLVKYPVTKKEIVDYLEGLYQEKLNDLAPGDMDCVLLSHAKAIVETHGDKHLEEVTEL